VQTTCYSLDPWESLSTVTFPAKAFHTFFDSSIFIPERSEYRTKDKEITANLLVV
jgi:hypothetical protein